MQEFIDLFKSHQWFALSVLIAPILLQLIKRYLGDITAAFPASLQFLPTSGLVFIAAFSEAATAGDGWEASLLSALMLTVMGGPASVGVYHMSKRLRKPPAADRKTPRDGVVISIVFLALALTGCAAFTQAKPALQTADAVAQQACAVFFGKQRSVSVEEAAEQFCKLKEQYQPWLDAVLRANRSVERSLSRGE